VYCGVAAASLAVASAGARPWRARLGWRYGVVTLAVAGAAGAAVYATNLRPVLASQHVQAARQAIGQERPERALTHYRRALGLAPGHEAHTLEFARVLGRLAQYRPAGSAERDGLYREAERLMDAAVARNPYEPEHQIARAALYRFWARATAADEGRRVRYARAVEAYEAALGIAPETIPARQGLAQTYAEMGDREGALGAYRAILARDSTNTAVYMTLASLYREGGQDAPAAAMYEGALRHARQPLPNVHQALAGLYRRQGQLGAALHHSRQAARLAPDAPAHREGLVGILETLGRCPEALREAQDALRRWPAHGGLTAQADRLGRQCAPAGGP
ncbi:MAG: tetratricopeptide repeat protein, partial [Rhodothermales bacterium]|nr:tetratricopeptide repeat protein [Rhodothermales bacterium]